MSTPGVGHNRPPKTKWRRGSAFVKYRITGFGLHNRLRHEEIVEVATQPDYIKQVTLTSYIDKILGMPGIVAVKFELKQTSETRTPTDEQCPCGNGYKKGECIVCAK